MHKTLVPRGLQPVSADGFPHVTVRNHPVTIASDYRKPLTREQTTIKLTLVVGLRSNWNCVCEAIDVRTNTTTPDTPPTYTTCHHKTKKLLLLLLMLLLIDGAGRGNGTLQGITLEVVFSLTARSTLLLCCLSAH